MKAGRRFLMYLAVMSCVAFCGLWYMRYEQRVESERYRLGYAQGVEIGELRQREEFKRNFNCYRITDADDSSGVVICGVLVPIDKNGNPIKPSLADPLDYEQ